MTVDPNQDQAALAAEVARVASEEKQSIVEAIHNLVGSSSSTSDEQLGQAIQARDTMRAEQEEEG